ncbi:MAG: hypothetical protein DCC71_22030 [Proteobacteria bacterium]|nr:MAG: hypothetical protein DCC71_22030 [Pseudomonadota bacterium]
MSAGATDPRVGLCSACRFARVQRSAKGSVFWRCARAAEDDRLRPYPPLPVRACVAFEAGAPPESNRPEP